jgi:hypothetical protein
MVTVMVMERHTPEKCAFFNEESAKTYIESMNKQKELEAKHGVKMVGGWNAHSEHLTVKVFEAPTFEAIQAFSMEPENVKITSVDTEEVKIVMPLEEAAQIMMQMMQAK